VRKIVTRSQRLIASPIGVAREPIAS